MEHFGIARPLATHWRRASCAEMDCPHYIWGWETLIDERTDFGKMQADYIRHKSGREFKEEVLANGLIRFEFHAGQRCFREHKVPLEREPLLTRGVPRLPVEMGRWIWEFNQNSYNLNQRRKQG